MTLLAHTPFAAQAPVHPAVGLGNTAPSPLTVTPPRHEAISLPDLVDAVCAELRPLLAQHRVTLLFAGDTLGLPPVFGQRDLLRAALWECMEAAVVHARLGADPSSALAMEMVFFADGNQVHLTLRSLGPIDVVTLTESGSAEPEPLAPAHEGVWATEPRPHVVFPFARVLLQSLGGQVVAHQSPDGGLALTLSIPEVPSTHTAPLTGQHHAQIYAGLLTRLTQTGVPTGQHSVF